MSVIELDASQSETLTRKDNYMAEVALCLDAAGVMDGREQTMRLGGNFHDFCPEFAEGTLRGAKLALAGAEVIAELMPELPVNRSLIARSAILTDIGKEAVGREVVYTSLEGKTWNKSLHEAIKPHAHHGCITAIKEGMPDVAKVIAEHHGAQQEPYGMGLLLEDVEQVARDIDTSEDVFEALFNRENTRNRHLDSFGRLQFSYNHMERFVFSHPLYKGREATIASALLERFMQVSPIEFQYQAA